MAPRWLISMPEFSLSRSRDKVLPETVTDAQGREIAIDPDFRTVLRCMRVLTDPDVSAGDAAYLLMLWFFKGVFVTDAFSLFASFLADGTETDGSEPPMMDCEQDADVIYASFLREYGIDLLETGMHWVKFRALLSGLSSQSALAARMQLRDMDTSKLKGKDKTKAEKAKRRVALRERVSAEEKAIQQELEQALAQGRDPAPILAKIRNMGGE